MKIDERRGDTRIREKCSEYCSLFAADGVPNNIREDPHVAEIIRLSDEELNDIAQTQIQRENQRKEEEKNKEEKGKLEQKIKTKLDSKVDEIFDEKAFYLRKQCPVKIPFKSTLSHEEHDAYLRVFLKIKEKPVMTLRQTAEYKHYLSLQHRVYEEQSNFMQFSHQVATLQLKNYNTVPEVITNYIDEYVEHRCKRALKYKEHYITEQQVPIRPQDPKRHFSKLSFTHIGHLLSLGTLPQFKIPYKCKLHELKIDDTVSKRERLSRSVTHDKNALTDTPVSVDRNAEYLAQQHQANIVISTSALKVLADNHGPNFDKEWDIPVEVKSYSVKDPDGRQIQHRVVYIDKPLPKKTWTPLEKQQLFFKKAFLATFTEIKQSKKFRLHPPPLFHYSEPDQGGCVGDAADAASRTVTKYDDDFFSLSHTTDTDVFGDESVGKTELITRTKNRKMNKKGIRTSPSTTKLSRSKAGKPQPPEGRAQDGKGNSNKRPQQLEVRDILPKAETTKNDDVTRTSEHFLNSEKYSKNQCSSDKGSTVNTCMTKKAGKQETSKNNSRDFLEDLLSMQGSLLKPLPTQGDEAEDQKDEASKSNKIPLRPWTNKLSTKWETLFEPHVCKYWTGKNVHYQLFSLGPDASQPTNSLWPMRVLVRSNLHGRSHFKFDKVVNVKGALTAAGRRYPRLTGTNGAGKEKTRERGEEEESGVEE
ncbi:Little elongation complex subunit 2 [Chionoecetes opilio]|uniref:Little elongation complex subunit 2 n=1 Tax=Chionoecetes opilio TaxID=41210 RepID=A0A8J4YM37_CHIOP|nr:Little elongation complex subunit 2 [Chionoecetes opilio]